MKLAIACVIAGALASPRVSSACSCSSPPLIVAPDGQSLVPPKPTFYIFAPNLLHDGTYFVTDIHITNTGTEHPVTTFRTTHIATDPKYVVFRVESDATQGFVTLHFHDGQDEAYRYMIADEPQPNRARIMGLQANNNGCSLDGEGAISLAVTGNPIAYAAQWSDGTTTFVPVHSDANEPSWIWLGASCDATNIEFARLHQLRDFYLYALFADGSQQLVGTSKMMVSRDEIRTPIELLSAKAERPAKTPVGSISVAIVDPTWSSIASGLAAGFTVVLGGVLLRRRRAS